MAKRRKTAGGKLGAWLREAAKAKPRTPRPAPAASPGGKLADWLRGSGGPGKGSRGTAARQATGGRPAAGPRPAKGKATGVKPTARRGARPAVKPTARPAASTRSRPAKRKATVPKPATTPRLIARLERQREDEKRAAKFRKATKGFRPRKAERGSLVFVSAKDGQRVGKGYRGKVFPLYVTRQGTVRPYTERGQRRRPPVPRSIRSLDPGQFRTRKSKAAAEKVLYAKTSRLVEPVTVASRARGGVDWDGKVVPAATDVLLAFAGVNTQAFQAAVGWTAVVEIVDPESGGSEFRTYSGAVDWKLSQAQVEQINSGILPSQWVVPWIQSKLYADMAQRVGEAEFVTVGSARFVQLLPQNRGKAREDWTDARGRKWEKWDYQDVRLRSLTLDVRLVTIAGK